MFVLTLENKLNTQNKFVLYNVKDSMGIVRLSKDINPRVSKII